MVKKKKTNPSMLTTEEFQRKKEQYLKYLKDSPQYSVLVDPEEKYNFTDDEKTFIAIYCEFKNIELAALLSKINMEKALALFGSYGAQQEIRRINNAMYQQQFSKKMLTLEEIGGYLTSLITDDVPTGDRVNSKDKIQISNILLKIHEMLNNSINDPKKIMEVDIEEELSNLSLDSLKLLLDSSNNGDVKKNKEEIIEGFKKYNNLTDEDISYLKSLSLGELLALLNELNINLEKYKKE